MSSPSRRATATAAAIAGRLTDVVIEVDDRWLETDVGLAEGLTFDEVADGSPTLRPASRAGRPRSTGRVAKRRPSWNGASADAWAAIVAAGRPSVVVSHAGSIRVAIAIATARRPDEVAFPEVASWSRHEIPAKETPVSR